ncbi:Hsp33 family molecular chaperone HslO [Clostridium sp. BIOML-A1]|jgi:hsp33 protein|uniref:Hsp33 family molecular chaperone HslO n=1 Tax=Clostridium sp. BIOML-A1 TaxID=2584627 RepID=UPI00136C7638|nr:Hsp33 family molecular chaperone HslO [Clostridium sp. BIOML-A1]MZH16566.1 Hsp33 family molecular chaperone HslO [Clostridium sp. BIOML-A1]
MSDYIIRGMAADGQVRFFAGTTKEIVETARSIHNTSPVATAALGRLLTAGALMGATCKNDSDLLTLQIQCSGPIGGLTVTADAHCNVKGYVNNPEVILHANDKGKLDVAKALDMGVLSVIKDIGLKEPYIGQTQLVSGEIAEDLTYYFATSEQIPTSVALGVLMEKNNTVKQAGGFIIQLMPFASEELISDLEKRLGEFTSITALLDQGMEPLDIVKQIFEGYNVEVTDTIPTKWHCNCSKERFSQAVISLGKKEIANLLADNKPIEVNCQFCNSSYTFSPEELENMLLGK